MNSYKRYAELKAHEADLKEEMAALSIEILAEIGDEPREENGYGMFSKVTRKQYTFSDRLAEREAEMKLTIARAKEREIRKGAKCQESISLRYSKPSDE